MFGHLESDAPTSKAVVTTGILPRSINTDTPPTKKQPFNAILSQAFSLTGGDKGKIGWETILRCGCR